MDDPEFFRLAQGVTHLRYDEILAHPRLADARRLYVDRFLALYAGDPFMARLLIETGRFLVFHIAVVLDTGHDPARKETWFTVGRLKRTMASFGFASERQVDHLVARLAAVGFLSSAPAEEDRRMHILKPTEKMLAHDRAWLAAHYAPLTVVSPSNDYQRVMGEDPVYQQEHRRAAIPFLPYSGQLLALSPDLLLFFKHPGGHLVSGSLIKSAMELGGRSAVVPFSEVGERFGISRTHVRSILETAQSAGLVRIHGRGGNGIEVLPRMLESYDRGIAAGMLVHDMIHAVVIGRKRSKHAGRAAPEASRELSMGDSGIEG